MRIAPRFDSDVFINCPFDSNFEPIFRALVFTVHDAGFGVRCAKEFSDSGEVRIEKLMRIIGECRYGIHDISCTTLDSHNSLPRFNMPFELGLFLGCQRFGNALQRRKYCLILDSAPYRYQQFLSDIAGQDIASHNGEAQIAVERVRKWLASTSKRLDIPSSARIWARFNQFEAELPAICSELLKDADELSFLERLDILTQWVLAHPLA